MFYCDFFNSQSGATIQIETSVEQLHRISFDSEANSSQILGANDFNESLQIWKPTQIKT